MNEKDASTTSSSAVITSTPPGSNLAKSELVFKSVASIGALITIVFGIIQYDQNATSDRATAIRDSERPFLERQLTEYFDAADAAAHLANTNDPTRLDKQTLDRFWNLYWGDLSLVESADVDHAMVMFGAYLVAYQHKKLAQTCLQQSALYLSHTLAKSLESEWPLNTPDASVSDVSTPYPVSDTPCPLPPP